MAGAPAPTPAYLSEAGTLNPQSTTHYMEFLTVNTGSSGSVTLTSAEVEVQWINLAANQNIYLFIYAGADPNSTTGITGSASGGTGIPIGSGVFQAVPTRLNESDYYNLTLTATSAGSLTFTSSATQLAVEIALTQPNPTGPTQFNDATGIRGDFDANTAPTYGTNPLGGVYSNSTTANDFVASNFTKFGNTTENIRLGLNPVPEPSTYALVAMAAGVVLIAVSRRARLA